MNGNQLRKLLASIQNKLDGKVNKEEGKGLSTNDLTDELKNNIPYTEEEVIFTLPAETIQEEYDKWVEGGKENNFNLYDMIMWNTQLLSYGEYYTDYCVRFGGKESLYMYVDHNMNDRICEFEGNDISLTLSLGTAYFSEDMDMSNITDLLIIKKTRHSTEGYSSDNLYVGDSLTVGGRLENSNISKGTLTCGVRNVASEQYSQALGEGTIASSECQHVIGSYNIKDEEGKYAHIVGHGESEWYRANIHTLDWKGNGWYKGDVYIGGEGQDDSVAKKLATEEYADTNFANKTSIENGKLYLLKKDGTKLDEGVTLPTSTGEKGDKGADGTSVTITNVTESTENGGSNIVTFSTGETLTIKNGTKGETGATGAKGADGEKGEKGEKGETGAKGDKGDAFTYEDFTQEQLASLKGEKGETGAKGDKGEKGETGAKGDKGDKGDSYVLTESDKTEIANTVKSDMPQLSFNENGDLIVTIGDVSKVFTPVIEE